MSAAAAEPAARSRSLAVLALMGMMSMALFAGFVALGTWQVHRRAWKLDLIARVDRRIHALPVAAPGRETWPTIGTSDEYRVVQAGGVFLSDRQVEVQAVTARGPGFWLMSPLQTDRGFIILVNRGFVAAGWKDPRSGQTESQVQVNVSGLLRASEPNGGFLRHNDPDSGRWYSRDVAAISAAQKLPTQDVAPYFIDAGAGGNADDGPVGGMTVIHFHNSHLIYAITWYTLALMVAGAIAVVGRQEWRLRTGSIRRGSRAVD